MGDIRMCDMTRSYVWRDSFIHVPCLIQGYDMDHLYGWHSCVRHDSFIRDSFICVTWLIHMCHVTYSYVWHDSFICVTWLIHMCDMTHSYVWHDSSTCVTWLIHMCDMTHPHVWHDSFICVTWLIHMCDMPHSYATRKPEWFKKRTFEDVSILLVLRIDNFVVQIISLRYYQKIW